MRVPLYDDLAAKGGQRWAGHPRGRAVDIAAVRLPDVGEAAITLLDLEPPPLTEASFWTSPSVMLEPDIAVRSSQVTDRLRVLGWP